MSRLVDLYPRAWRARYGEELADLAAARPLGLVGSIDLVRGAVDAHRHPELVDPAVAVPTGAEPVSRQRYEDLRFARRLGAGSLAGAGIWLIGLAVAANGPLVRDGEGVYRDGAAGMPFILLATTLLSAGLLGQLIRIPRRRLVARLGALIALFTAPVWGLAPWLLFVEMLTIIGLVILALDAWWSGEWSGPASLAVIATCLASVGLVWTAIAAHNRGAVLDGMMAGVVLLSVSWLVVGATLQRLPDVDASAAEDQVAEAATA